jgi:hypothetical protein
MPDRSGAIAIDGARLRATPDGVVEQGVTGSDCRVTAGRTLIRATRRAAR